MSNDQCLNGVSLRNGEDIQRAISIVVHSSNESLYALDINEFQASTSHLQVLNHSCIITNNVIYATVGQPRNKLIMHSISACIHVTEKINYHVQ